MADESVARILMQLQSKDSHAAWSDFLREYSQTVLQVIRRLERDPDCVSDCFLFVCEQLAHQRFRRLKRFRVRGPASFSTWLQVVVRHLCLDWRRKEFGRWRVFQSVARLSPLDQEVFRCLYDQGASVDESVLLLAPQFPAISHRKVLESVKRLENALSPRQRWLLAARQAEASDPPAVAGEDESPVETVPDLGPSPESAAILEEQQAHLQRALDGLAPRERLVLQLRFEEELTLEQIARLMALGDAQRVDRFLRQILARLRKALGGAASRAEKSPARP